MKKIMVVFALSGLLFCNVTYADYWTITQLTDNNTDDIFPFISGINVV